MSATNRPKAAVIGYCPAFDPPKSGGEARLHHLWRALAERFDVNAVTPTFPEAYPETVRHTPHLTEKRIPKKAPHVRWHRRLDRIGGFPECSALVVALAGRHDYEFMRAATEAIDQAEIVLFEGPYFPYLKARPDQLQVYLSQNVEYRLQAQTWRGPAAPFAVRYVRRQERRFVRTADLTFTCSEEDRRHYIDVLGGYPERHFVAPNGTKLDRLASPASNEDERVASLLRLAATSEVLKLRHDSPLYNRTRRGRPRCIFLGSSFPTNLEAAAVIEQILAPALPEIDFFVAGSCCRALEGIPPDNVFRLGFVDDGQPKECFLRMAHIALNPVLSGSGTSVKMLDFFGAGLPVLATPMGARGMTAFYGRGLFEEPATTLAGRLADLLNHRSELARLGLAARRVVEREFQWETIGGNMVEAIEHRLAPRRVLIAVDYPVWPPDHGGKVRVTQEARILASAGMPTTILSLNKEGACGSRLIAPGIVEVAVPRSERHNRFDEKLRGRLGGILAADDITCYLRPGLLKNYRQAARRLAESHSAAILSHPYLSALLPELKRSGLTVHDAHNAEIRLKEPLFAPKLGEARRTSAEKQRLVRAVKECESRAVDETDALVATSQNDLDFLRNGHCAEKDRCFLVPNGVDCEIVMPTEGETERRRLKEKAGVPPDCPIAIFIGSAHLPNVDAARFIAGDLALTCSEVLFLIVGSVCEALDPSVCLPNVRLLGRVPEQLKLALLRMSDVALNPVEQGSGTNLKTVEFMAAGLPLVATRMGARGTAGTSGEELVVVDLPEMPDALRDLIADEEKRKRIGRAARRLAEDRFDWPVAMAPLVEFFQSNLQAPPQT